MKPSACSTSSTLPRSVEPGVETLPRLRICALRMRVSISPRGSFTDMIAAPSPTRLDQARDQALVAQFPERDAAHLHLPIITSRTPGYLAAVAHARHRAVARQRGELDTGVEPLFHRQLVVVGDFEQPLAPGGEFLRHPDLALVILDCTLLCHKGLHVPRLSGQLTAGRES